MIQKKMQETGSLISVRNAHLLVVKRMLIEKRDKNCIQVFYGSMAD